MRVCIASKNGQRTATCNVSSPKAERGNLLLRSDVCYAGQNYCLTLAAFGTASSVDYLDEYLEYHLGRTDLWFDQESALAALHYLDEKTGTNRAARHQQAWSEFVKNKENWDVQSGLDRFRKVMDSFNQLRSLVNKSIAGHILNRSSYS